MQRTYLADRSFTPADRATVTFIENVSQSAIWHAFVDIRRAILRAVPTEGSRATWTDERLDDLARRMDDGFARIDARIDALDSRIDAQGESLGARIDAYGANLNARIDALGAGLNAHIDALQRTMLAMMATMLIGFVAVLVQL